uniref:ASD2 domain-containing protein n=1 Tax=Rhabditophanes sp. KR3021 TaxID=114890 RepID=A0AC35TLZ0_9BILA
MSSASSTNIFTNVNYHISKPTIEVHPMPAPRKNSNALTYSSADSSPSSTLDKGVKKIPPPVPRKPAKFTFKATSATSFTATNDDSLINSTKDHCMDNDNISKDDYGIKQDPNIIGKARFDSMPSLLINNPQHYTGNNNNKENEKTFSKSFMKTDNNNAFSMSASTSNLYNGHTGLTNTMYSAQSSESLNQLYRSPSLVSLQNAFRNTQLMNEQEIDELEEKRKLTIETLKKKMHILEIEQENINQDVIGNENIKNHLFKTSHIDETILKKLNNHVNQSKTLVLLETKVKLKLDKLNGILSDHDESEFCKTRRARLEEQLEDSKILRNYHCDRDIELDNIIYPNYLSQDEMANWRFYKETLWKLLVEKMHVNDRLIYSKHQLLALEQIGTQSDLLMRYHHRQTSSGASSLTSDKIVHKSHELADPISSCIV